MKILMVNKFHYIKGGSETYYFALKEMLEKDGHQVIDFSMADDKNFPSPYETYFVDNVDYGARQSIIRKIKLSFKIIYSFEAKKKFEALVKKEKPDIVHLHIFQHQISPSILDVCKKYHIPTVYTAHDLKMICANYKMMHHGHICEDCMGGKLYRCTINKCVKDSFVKSMANMFESYFHRWRRSYDVIGRIITPSDFYRTKFIDFGIESERVVHIPNFLIKLQPTINVNEESRKYYLYFGRLSEEKGVLTLIKSFENTELPLYIVGTGPLDEELNGYLEKKRIANVKMLGFQSGQILTDIVGNAKAVIVPSEWYENGPYSAIEALQMGRPIIGAKIGGIPELVNGNGFLFQTGSVNDLKRVISKFESLSEEEYLSFERRSKEIFESNYTWKKHSEQLYRAYRECLTFKQ